jgi:exodeoxyribonuclease III
MKMRIRGAGVDRHVRGWEKASDHAPTWLEIAEENEPARKTVGKKATAVRRPR